MMNRRNCTRIAPALTILTLISLVALPTFTASGRVETTEPMATAPDKQVTLGGLVTLQPLDFERAYDRPLIASSPFTVEQIKAIAGSRLSKVGNQFFIINKKKQAVPVENYVAQLNQYETFLNKYGLTLRDGPLALPVAKQGPVNSNLGTILKLKPKSKSGAHINDRVAAKKIVFDPTIYERSGKLTNPGTVTGNPVTNQPTTTASRIGQAGQPAVKPGQVQSPAGGRSFTEIRLPQSSAGGGQRVMEHKSLCPCVAGCGGIDLGNPILVGTCPIPPCADTGGSGGASTSATTSKGVQCGEKDVTKKCYPTCLYQGLLGAEWKGLSYCTNTGSDNGWFDAGLCMELNASMCGGVGGNLNLRNAASMHMYVKLFGLDFELLDAVAESRYKSGQTAPDGYSKVTIFGSNLEIPHKDFSQSFSGPQITVLIGPVPITIKSGLNAKLSLGQTDFPLTVPSQQCGAGTGVVGMGIGVGGYADMWASASIDAYVAEAGIEAKLILADDFFGVGMSTSVIPSQNTVRVEPGFNYRLKHLAGVISLFVEVDLIVYSKRWSVEIFNFPGLNTGNKTIALDKKEFAAIFPPKS